MIDIQRAVIPEGHIRQKKEEEAEDADAAADDDDNKKDREKKKRRTSTRTTKPTAATTTITNTKMPTTTTRKKQTATTNKQKQHHPHVSNDISRNNLDLAQLRQRHPVDDLAGFRPFGTVHHSLVGGQHPPPTQEASLPGMHRLLGVRARAISIPDVGIKIAINNIIMKKKKKKKNNNNNNNI